MERVVNDWFIPIQNNIIQNKIESIKFWNKDIELNLRLRDKAKDLKIIFLLNDLVEEERKYIKVLWESIGFNKEVINESRKRQNNLVIRDAS